MEFVLQNLSPPLSPKRSAPSLAAIRDLSNLIGEFSQRTHSLLLSIDQRHESFMKDCGSIDEKLAKTIQDGFLSEFLSIAEFKDVLSTRLLNLANQNQILTQQQFLMLENYHTACRELKEQRTITDELNCRIKMLTSKIESMEANDACRLRKRKNSNSGEELKSVNLVQNDEIPSKPIWVNHATSLLDHNNELNLLEFDKRKFKEKNNQDKDKEQNNGKVTVQTFRNEKVDEVDKLVTSVIEPNKCHSAKFHKYENHIDVHTTPVARSQRSFTDSPIIIDYYDKKSKGEENGKQFGCLDNVFPQLNISSVSNYSPIIYFPDRNLRPRKTGINLHEYMSSPSKTDASNDEGKQQGVSCGVRVKEEELMLWEEPSVCLAPRFETMEGMVFKSKKHMISTISYELRNVGWSEYRNTRLIRN